VHKLWTSKVYRQAASAILLPALCLVFGATEWYAALARYVLRRDLTTWLAVGAIAALILLELKYVAVLFRFIRVKGDLVAYQARMSDPQRTARRRIRNFRAANGLLGIVLGFLLAEALFRIFNIQPPPVLRPSHWDVLNVDNTLNAMGIREDWDAIPEDDRRLRIAFLGDSITYGYSVQPQQSFCHLLEGMLASDWPTGVLTINLGYSATGPVEQHERYVPLRDILRPDVVVHVLFLNDVGYDAHHLVVRIHGVTRHDSWPATQSYVWRYAEKQYRRWQVWHEALDYFRGGQTPEERARSWATFEDGVRKCKAAAEQGGAVYCVVLFPWLFQLEQYPLTDVHARIRDLAAELGAPFLDLLATFEGREWKSVCVSPVNEHPSPEGHRIAAEAMAQFLREKVLPEIQQRAGSADPNK
jgi:lysophospholipase L1-like esterase